ncbi:hypothetical protein N8J89_33220 [Crossiella sp. CA-258035]|uniref:hypothetical protein n=1 Tax=Crossiella sp. CA-258035 TaxID=2981138 RepID=UPI0024BC2942|nr:hypothetical protein [Crossiella sp. CA-258035]WHT17936.1 hypothetical protein N8J89_33220 [Crossiella sp. CA-258035]
MTWSGDQGNRGGGEFTGAYGGLGVFGEGQPEPPKNRWRMAIIAALSLVIVVGLVLVVVLLTRDETPPPVAQTTPATSSASGGSGTAGSTALQTITNAEAGLTYKVPANWEKGAEGMSRTTSGPILRGMAARHPYTCNSLQYTRAEVGSGRTDDNNLARAATELAKNVATRGYTVDKVEPKVTTNEPKNFDNAGTTGVLVVANTTAAKTSECNAPRGQVVALATKGAKGTSVFVLDVSYEGKFADRGPTDAEVRQILDSVRLVK